MFPAILKEGFHGSEIEFRNAVPNEKGKRPGMIHLPGRRRGRPRVSARPGPVRALDRGLALLEALSRAEGAGLGDLALQTGMPPSSAHRLLQTLRARQFAEFDSVSETWRVGIEAFRAGSGFLSRSGLQQASLKAMHALVEETGETANLAVPHAGRMVFIGQVESRLPIRACFAMGTDAPAHASGIGKAVLAHMTRSAAEALLEQTGLPTVTARTVRTAGELFRELAEVRQNGWAVDDEEGCVGMRCVAAAILGPGGVPVAGVSVSGPRERLTDAKVARFGPLALAAANRITADIGGPKRDPDFRPTRQPAAAPSESSRRSVGKPP